MTGFVQDLHTGDGMLVIRWIRGFKRQDRRRDGLYHVHRFSGGLSVLPFRWLNTEMGVVEKGEAKQEREAGPMDLFWSRSEPWERRNANHIRHARSIIT